MKQLYDICQCDVKIWNEFPDGTHNDTVASYGYFIAIDEFLTRYVDRQRKGKI